jgi:glycosyltransferase involved in cell wall biosynthesis
VAKADLSIAIIARNAEKTIGACLDSLVPYVKQVLVCVDQTTTDGTQAVARRHGARVERGFVVSEPHECPEHGKIVAQHFANARQRSFDLLPPTEWWGWVDADDVVQNGAKLPAFLAALPQDVAGLWLPYHYSQAGEGGPTATLFDRERIVRRSVGWKWQHRVHEILVPREGLTEHLNWQRTDQIAIVHQGQGHDTTGSARRNITLLEIDLEDDPNDERTLFYMGNQYFALSEWETAIYWYDRARRANNPYQRWQTLIYLSRAYERLGDLDASTQAAYEAVETAPYHPEPYYRLAAVAMYKRDVQRCEFWTRLGDQMVPPPFFAFKNPLDRPFNARVTLGQAYANDGQVTKARHQLEQALQAMPANEQIRQGIAEYQQMEQDAVQAEQWANVLSSIDGPLPKPPEHLWKFGRVRDVVVPVLLKQRVNTQPRIVFFCGRSLEPWAPPSLDTTGIGGSETAVIQIAKRFAADGWRVDVYNEPDRLEGEYEGVGYWGLSRLGQGEKADVFVSWRNPQLHDLPLERRLSLLWCHDLNSGPGAGAHLQHWDSVLGVSQWHASYLSQLYGLSNTGHVPNGIDLARFSGNVKRVPWRCVYASSPDRGLANILRMWPVITKDEPGAELHVAYGWETFDKSIAMGATQLIPIKQEVEALLASTPRVKWRGRLPQNELAKLYQESYLLLYGTPFLEVSCITAMEAMAGGCVPVVSAAGALPETVGEGGLVVEGNTYTQAWKDFYAMCARAVLLTPGMRKPLSVKGQERAKQLTWDAAYQDYWKSLVWDRLLAGQKELVTA